MSGFQIRLRRQITRFSLLLALGFFLVFMGLLLFYSVYFSSYRARNYNQVLAGEFAGMYEEYRDYTATRGEGWEDFLRCLDGEISGTALSLIYQSFSRDRAVPSNLILTDREGRVAATTYRDLTYSQTHFNAQVVENAMEAGGILYNTVYFYDDAPRYVFAQPVYDLEGDFRGVACLYLDTDVLTRNMRTLQYSGVIVHGNSAVVVAGDQGLVKSFNHFYGVEDGRFRLNGQEYWMASSQLPQYNVKVYTYVGVIPMWGYYLICVLFSILFFFLAMLLALYVTRKIAQHSAASVEQLQREIDQVAESGGGELSMRTGDEFEDIANHINSMLESIRELTGRNIELLKLNNQMEMRTLEAKFDPHFLYNTLESIRFAIQLGLPGADAILLDLTKLLRYSVGNREGEVTVGEDLPHILSYLDIIKFRFGDRFCYEIDMDEACMTRHVPKLLLQPVIENSVKYGFQGRQSVKLSIRGEIGGGGLLKLTVVDDGMGMEPERLAQVRSWVTDPGEVPEGAEYSELQSTARRLRLQYGGESRMEIESISGAGTRVVLFVAARRAAT